MGAGSFTALLEELVTSNQEYAAAHPSPDSARPRLALAVVACMDARLDVEDLLGLEPGDAHVIRNAGGIVTDDVIRSLCLSQMLLDTRAIVLVHHTDCGLEGVSDQDIGDLVASEAGHAPDWEAGGFDSVDASVQASMQRLGVSPFLIESDMVAGFVFDTVTGHLRRIHPAS